MVTACPRVLRTACRPVMPGAIAIHRMQFSKGRIALLVMLAASLVCNLLLGLAARHYYISAKLRAAEPTFVQHYSRQNLTVQSTKGHQFIALFGDSRIAAWNPAPRIAGYDLVNRGIGGETTAQMLYRFNSDVLALRPEFVVIQAGINDLVAAGLAPDAEARIFSNTFTNIASMVEQAKASGIKVILLTIIPPATPGLFRRIVWSERIAILVAETNQKLALLNAPPSVRVIDTQRALQTADGAWKENVILDTLHLAPAGYTELNSAVSHLFPQR